MIYKCSLYDIADNSRITSERYGNDFFRAGQVIKDSTVSEENFFFRNAV